MISGIFSKPFESGDEYLKIKIMLSLKDFKVVKIDTTTIIGGKKIWYQGSNGRFYSKDTNTGSTFDDSTGDF